MIKPYFDDPGFQLYYGDSLRLLVDLPAESADMIFADPPYRLSNGGFTVQNGRRASVHKGDWDRSNGPESDFAFHQRWIRACRRVLKPQGTLWVSGTYHSIYWCGASLLQAGYTLLNDITWYKPNAVPNLSCRYFTASHETLIWARKEKKARHRFNYDAMKHGEWEGDFLKNPGKQMRSVWAINSPRLSEKRFGKHPTQKPLELLKRIILASTDEGDVVLDPFTGSSTTGIAARLLGREFIGIDSEKAYLDLSVRRFQALSKEPVFA